MKIWMLAFLLSFSQVVNAATKVMKMGRFDNIPSIKVVNSLHFDHHFWFSTDDCQFSETLASVEMIDLGTKRFVYHRKMMTNSIFRWQ